METNQQSTAAPSAPMPTTPVPEPVTQEEMNAQAAPVPSDTESNEEAEDTTVPYLTHAVLSLANGLVLNDETKEKIVKVSAKTRAQLEHAINDAASGWEKCEILFVIKGREVSFQESKQVSLKFN